MTTNILLIIQIVSGILVAPLVLGLIEFMVSVVKKTDRVLPWKKYKQLIDGAKQGIVVPEKSSTIYSIVPLVTLGLTLTLFVLLPLVTYSDAFAGLSNIFVVTSILFVIEGFDVLGRMERGLAVKSTTLPLMFATILLALTAIVFDQFVVGGSNGSVDVMDSARFGFQSILLLPLGALFVLLISDRIQAHDAPRKFTGFFSVTSSLTDAIRYTAIGAFITNLLFPFGIVGTGALTQSVAIAIGLFVLRSLIAGAIIGIIEGAIVGKKFVSRQSILFLSTILAFIGLVLSVIISTL